MQPSLIRVEADEVTYNLHILIRFELELALMRDQLEVAELPGAWGDAYERTLGLRPENDVLGVMQDIHWSHGSFGYFPTYTLGNLYSALLWDAYRKDDPAAEEHIGAGEFQHAPGLDARARAPCGRHRPGRGSDPARDRLRARPRAVHAATCGRSTGRCTT